MNRENVRDFNGVGREVRRWRQGEEDGSSNYIFSLTKKKKILFCLTNHGRGLKILSNFMLWKKKEMD